MVAISHNLDKIGEQLGVLIRDYAKGTIEDVDKEFLHQATLLRNDIVRGWPVDTGASRAGWQGPIRRGYAHYEVVNNFVYAPIIEFGGYPGVGPKTQFAGGVANAERIDFNPGIYPTQKPPAPVRRALSKRKKELQDIRNSLGQQRRNESVQEQAIISALTNTFS